MPNYDSQHDGAVQTESKQKLQKPPLYKVLLHNDNYTTMEFVVHVLVEVFNHAEVSAYRIMLQVHNQGMGVAGVYTFEIAETKIAKVIRLAREHEYPLLCTMEEE
jgi:ATP-dependent Clp protease adaptor protein ClpS